MTKSNQTQFTISVIKNRKPRIVKTQLQKDAEEFADELLSLLHNELLGHIEGTELFVSVIVNAAQDLRKVR